MKYMFLVFLLYVDAKLHLISINEDVQQIGARFYKKILLTNEYEDPKELTYDSASRNLFFSYMDDDLANSGRGVINVITKTSLKVSGIARNKATGVDGDTSEVYFGSVDGLYKYDALNNNVTHLGLYNVNIMKIIIRNNEMFIIDANNHMIYKIKDNRKAFKVGEWKTVMEFEVDYNNNIHFVNMCGLFCAPKGEEAIKNTDLPLVYHFLSDDYNNTFGVTENGLYELYCRNGTAKRVADLDFYIRSITFGDYGDIYYSTDDSIFRLTPIHYYVQYIIRSRS